MKLKSKKIDGGTQSGREKFKDSGKMKGCFDHDESLLIAQV